MGSTSAVCRRSRSSHRRGSWCCSFTVPPSSPEAITLSQKSHTTKSLHHHGNGKGNGGVKPEKPRDSFSKLSFTNSIPNSPQSSKSGLGLVGRIDPRRILSPGRVSPIDPDSATEAYPDPNLAIPSRSGSFRSQSERFSMTQLHAESFRDLPESPPAVPEDLPEPASLGPNKGFDVRLNLRSKKAGGGSLVLELSSEVLCSNSEVFAGLVAKYKKGSSGRESSSSVCRIEVPDVENLGVFRETIELMFEDDIAKSLMKIGVYRCIDVLEVSVSILFTRGVASCLKYIEAIPWTEEEEEKLRGLFTRVKFDEATINDIMYRLCNVEADCEQNLAKQLVCSITSCTDQNARNELKSLVKGLLSKSSVYEKDNSDLNKEEIYGVCRSCLASLVTLFNEASGNIKSEEGKPLIERISREVDNINWLLEILLDRQMAEDFVSIWADEEALAKLHEVASPMVRYELSRVSAVLFIAMGTRKLQCGLEARSGIFHLWFRPILSDFGWLQRCQKGLEMKLLEEAMGQVLLTLPLKQQYGMFMEWFRCFSKQGSECPNLSKPFQIWWRRSFLRGSETHSIECR
ncbi:BTB/POZ domain-containing protein At2g13690-like [Punica granatum]|uniref:BTB/POZ domain-containing protein At2g13690-like n=2 Tax=Punica granatum TaxID=22663 RepID=A0A6P8BY41_PUNGR|nr:BTB/POZ domain-containing protein At2g13690-like [Punica granatum]XP_031401707.1 BTB/POZ domain-containing protein At2g13690-like [Punica granatum]PKI42250.1 hypothetical protein CRG98_037366 [Punica granatum]